MKNKFNNIFAHPCLTETTEAQLKMFWQPENNTEGIQLCYLKILASRRSYWSFWLSDPFYHIHQSHPLIKISMPRCTFDITVKKALEMPVSSIRTPRFRSCLCLRSSFLQMGILGGSNDGSSPGIPTTLLGVLCWVLVAEGIGHLGNEPANESAHSLSLFSPASFK